MNVYEERQERRRERLLALSARPDVVTDAFTLSESVEDNRIRIRFRFHGKPSEAVRSVLKSCAFRWCPSEGAWQTMLSGRGRWNADRAATLLSSI